MRFRRLPPKLTILNYKSHRFGHIWPLRYNSVYFEVSETRFRYLLKHLTFASVQLLLFWNVTVYGWQSILMFLGRHHSNDEAEFWQ
jgi:hypothetical protein